MADRRLETRKRSSPRSRLPIGTGLDRAGVLKCSQPAGPPSSGRGLDADDYDALPSARVGQTPVARKDNGYGR